MIKNVIFDFGQVLIHFDPKYMVERYVKDEADSKLLQEVIFDRLYWDKLDAGTISDDAVVESCKQRLPQRLHNAVVDIYYNWIYNIPEIDGMRDVIAFVKEKLCARTFLLSNICTYFAELADEISILKELEGCVYSAVCGYTKPSKEIFEHICNKYNLIPSETLFIDDSKKNIDGAIAYGINGYLFDGDAKKLKEYLETLV